KRGTRKCHPTLPIDPINDLLPLLSQKVNGSVARKRSSVGHNCTVRDQHFAFQLATRQLREVVVALRTSHHICVVSVPTTVVLNVRDIYLPNIKIFFPIETRIDHDHTSNPKFRRQRSNNQFLATSFRPEI